MAKEKEAKFFCEYCDTEVPRNARFCPKCGHFFLSVRCPACGLTGDQDDFTDGCPACGYAFGSGKPRADVEEKIPPETGKKTRKKALHLIDRLSENDMGGTGKQREDPLPFWMYFTAMGVLIVLILILFSRI